MRILGLGQWVFALGIIAIGALSLGSGDFTYDWQPVAAGLPLRALLAYCSGALLVATGAGLFTQRLGTLSAGVLTLFLFFWLLVLHGIQVVKAPLQEGSWEISGETAVLTAGAWVLFASQAEQPSGLESMGGAKGLRGAGLLLGLALLPIGLSHFVYIRESTQLVPAWLPYRAAWAYFTGLCHAAAGVALLLGVLPRLAAGLEALMLLGITLLVNVPYVMAAPHNRYQWTWLCVDMTLAASAWLVAWSHRGTGWLSFRPRR